VASTQPKRGVQSSKKVETPRAEKGAAAAAATARPTPKATPTAAAKATASEHRVERQQDRATTQPQREKVEIDLRKTAPIMDVTVEVKGLQGSYQCTLDTGAGWPIVAAEIFGKGENSPKNFVVTAADGVNMEVHGVKTLSLTFFGATFETQCVCVSNLDGPMLLGVKFLNEYGFNICFEEGNISFPTNKGKIIVPIPHIRPPTFPKRAVEVSTGAGDQVEDHKTHDPKEVPRSPNQHSECVESAPSGGAAGERRGTGAASAKQRRSTRARKTSTDPPQTEWSEKRNNFVRLRTHGFVYLQPGVPTSVHFSPLLTEDGVFIPSTKWAARKVNIADQVIHAGQRYIWVTNERASEQLVRPDEVLGKLTPFQTIIPTYKCTAQLEADEESGAQFGPEIPAENKQKFIGLMRKFKKIFDSGEDVKAVKGFEYEILHSQDITPIQSKPLRLSVEKQEALEKYVSDLEKAKIIEKCQSPFNARSFVVPKRTPGSFRFVTDFSKLSKALYPDPFPVANFQTVKELLAQSRLVTMCDFKSAYHQISLKKECRALTAFCVATDRVRQQYQYLRCPQGLSISGSALARFMDLVLGELQAEGNVVTYADDLFILSKGDYDEHYKIVDEVFRKLEKFGVTLSAEKTCFALKRFTALGFSFSPEGYTLSGDLMKAIQSLAVPTTLKQLRSFYGLLLFGKLHIKNFDEETAALVRLLKPEFKYQRPLLDEAAEKAFHRMKKLMSEPPFLQEYRSDDKLIIITDASKIALGWHILAQRATNEDIVTLGFGSKRLTIPEAKLGIAILEAMAVALCLEKHPRFFRHKKVLVVTDHIALTKYSEFTSSNTKINRLLSILSCYDLTIIHAKGKDNLISDYLSRYPGEDLDNIPATEFLEVYRVSADVTEVPLLQKLNEQQESDEKCSEIRNFVERGVIAPGVRRTKEQLQLAYENYSVINNILCHKYIGNMGEVVWSPCSPPGLREEFLILAHDRQAHPGKAETLLNLKEIAFWPGMNTDVQNYVKRCDICAKVKRNYVDKTQGKMCSRTPEAPWTDISCDFVGPFPASGRKNRFILAIQDVFSNYISLYATPDNTTARAIKILKNEYLIAADPPKRIITDNDKIFVGTTFGNFCKSIGAEHIPTPGYTQRANCVERSIQEMKVLMRLNLHDKKSHGTWDEYIPSICRYLRNRTCSTTGLAPTEIIFGRKLAPCQGPVQNFTPAQADRGKILRATQGETGTSHRESALSHSAKI